MIQHFIWPCFLLKTCVCHLWLNYLQMGKLQPLVCVRAELLRNGLLNHVGLGNYPFVMSQRVQIYFKWQRPLMSPWFLLITKTSVLAGNSHFITGGCKQRAICAKIYSFFLFITPRCFFCSQGCKKKSENMVTFESFTCFFSQACFVIRLNVKRLFRLSHRKLFKFEQYVCFFSDVTLNICLHLVQCWKNKKLPVDVHIINAKVFLFLLHHNYHLILQNTRQHITLLIFFSLLINLLWLECIWTFKGLLTQSQHTVWKVPYKKTLNWSFQTGGYPNILTSATTNWTAGTRLMGLFTVESPIGSPIKDVLHQKVSQSCIFAIVLFLDGVIVGMNGSVFWRGGLQH